MTLTLLRNCALVAALAAPATGIAADAAAAERGRTLASASCFLCHGMRGEVATDLVPRLAGQNAVDLERHLRDFRDRRRTGGGMEGFAARLSDDDIAAIALFYSQQK
jgi:cytochrome c553